MRFVHSLGASLRSVSLRLAGTLFFFFCLVLFGFVFAVGRAMRGNFCRPPEPFPCYIFMLCGILLSIRIVVCNHRKGGRRSTQKQNELDAKLPRKSVTFSVWFGLVYW